MRLIHTMTSVSLTTEAEVSAQTLVNHGGGKQSFDIVFEDQTPELLAITTLRLTMTRGQARAMLAGLASAIDAWDDEKAFRAVAETRTEMLERQADEESEALMPGGFDS